MRLHDPDLIRERADRAVRLNGEAHSVRFPTWREEVEWDSLTRGSQSLDSDSLTGVLRLLHAWLPTAPDDAFDRYGQAELLVIGYHCCTGAFVAKEDEPGEPEASGLTPPQPASPEPSAEIPNAS